MPAKKVRKKRNNRISILKMFHDTSFGGFKKEMKKTNKTKQKMYPVSALPRDERQSESDCLHTAKEAPKVLLIFVLGCPTSKCITLFFSPDYIRLARPSLCVCVSIAKYTSTCIFSIYISIYNPI